ncbi:hypothetical protein Pmar_PMAR025947 [Perkinsus marinus ATCC 50983]|uniref:Phospholipase D-like domain-containing protein n=1 Tax=Perkinsus marinus (strain ATCC 50983 / TXsc) TaxID=423536 RepID=C5L1G8_PERM5|nr:hypothetical protein Pmar_PMAR025947 [Perkinsus marinus ATCC 50983]EER09395.1 hypothetical protein Pmar_PMAR025947 [Perkinsus marinus ATCC 50983]|eukprot:XP_002777579.1 hypothetical protein Pmar_PMAR025947 [Perkinsus marinus ATCC 50983]
MLDAIDSAKDRVWMESYIFDGSAVAEKFYQALIRAKQRGVDVILILDACGGSAFRKEWLEGLRSFGVPVVVFNPMLPFLTDTIGPPCFRDHRKILVADSNIVDGLNIYNTQWRLRKELLVKALNKEAGITVATGMMWGLC